MEIKVSEIKQIAGNNFMSETQTNSTKDDRKMKIELDIVNGMTMVSAFDSNTEIVTGTLKLKDFLKDELENRLGFEVTEEEAQSILDAGYSINGFSGKRARINVAAFAFYHDKGIEGYKIPITRKFFDTVISKDIQE